MTLASQTSLSPILSPLLEQAAPSGIRHGFFGRQGGVSTGIYRGLNVGTGSNDLPEHIHENRARVAGWFNAEPWHLSTLYQVHSPDVVTVETPDQVNRPKADGQVTATPGVALGILTADCGPVLFADPEARVVGAAHAGWKGAFDGVLENTIEAMVRLGANRNRIKASLGPSISRRSYEVGPEFVERFLTRDASWARFFGPSEKHGHSMFDLPALTISRLQAAGIEAENLDICTYADEDRFFSYRRTTHRQDPDYGRQISAIMIGEF
ncbi:peptidoglycan editing factor PgeF [Rhizobium sp. KVB221]|uniref:Purine nucleoside phosphorylase n=1 Tax=Rhizobium setariae TaxID=2801340 RepID=A0A937CNG5_9HYPH|nr:peptidoglycan editing factor PgeF [Rhizobium setariae]MBL0371964.1 peptidoglycan editing factor PgeF [Rhizobium setariae]